MALGTAESAAVIIVLLGNLSAWGKMIYDARRKPNGNSSVKMCPAHLAVESRMATIETEKTGIEKSLETLHQENRQDHTQIFTEIKTLAVSVSIASEAARTAAAAATAATAAAAASQKRGRA
jgi:hypothetical protein